MEDREQLKAKIKKNYAVMQKKYNLPRFDALDKEFELIKLEHSDYILREVRRAIMRSCQNGANLFIPIINPHPGDLHSILEGSIFNEAEKKKIMLLYKKMWYFVHKGILAGVGTEKDDAQFIKDFWKAWPGMKKEYAKYTKKITESWKKISKKEKEDVAYVG